jgi:hypothetical protein
MNNNIDIRLDKEEKQTNRLWIISEGNIINLDPSSICEEPVSGPVTEYKISELGYYLLNPNPITLEEKVIGCKIKYKHKSAGGLRKLFKKSGPDKDTETDNNDRKVEELISTSKAGAPELEDETLNAHFIKISEMLRPYNPVQKKLASLEKRKIDDITAICEEIGRTRYPLNLQGTIDEKINFVSRSLSQKAKVVFNKAYLLNGLFELRGFRFKTYNPDNFYRLIKFTQDNKPKYYVTDFNFKFEFWVNDNSLINYMHIIEQAVKSDPKLREVLLSCINGTAKPLKLFFSKKLEQKYTDIYLPATYREVFSALNIGKSDKETVTQALNDYQYIVFLNYVPGSKDGKQKLFTNISVMHDLRALEPIRYQVPELYSEITKKLCVSDAGKLYLLDSMRESQNV